MVIEKKMVIKNVYLGILNNKEGFVLNEAFLIIRTNPTKSSVPLHYE